MPRPCRCRRVCAEPACRRFEPQTPGAPEPVVLNVDEYEVLRLVDFEQRTHEECARQMQVSRTTVTEIYERARFKLADALVNSRPLVIEGGRYRLCEEKSDDCCPGRCPRHNTPLPDFNSLKGNIMRIAIPVKNEDIYQHFGMAAFFKIYDVEENRIVNSQVVQSTGRGHGAMFELLQQNGVQCVICGGIGAGAVEALQAGGIRLLAGVRGNADEAVNAFLQGTLTASEEGSCDHHHQHHGEGGCGCGCSDDESCHCRH